MGMGFYNLEDRPNVANGIEFNRGTIRGWIGYEMMTLVENLGGWIGVVGLIVFVFIFVVGTHFVIYNKEMFGFGRRRMPPRRGSSTAASSATTTSSLTSNGSKKKGSLMKKKKL